MEMSVFLGFITVFQILYIMLYFASGNADRGVIKYMYAFLTLSLIGCFLSWALEKGMIP